MVIVRLHVGLNVQVETQLNSRILNKIQTYPNVNTIASVLAMDIYHTSNGHVAVG
jgi:hypothetical protein